MTTLLSVITSVKDYIEIAHKLIEVDSSPGSQSVWLIQNYTEFGAFLTYFLITLKQFCIQLFSFHWLKNIWSLPVMVPEIASAMVSEISVLDGFFHNAFTFLDTPLSYGQFGSASEVKNFNVYAFEKFFIGFINSFFLFLPTSTAHIITIRRFVMQGLEAGYVSALGTIAGNFLWLCSIIFGWRFFVIPWLSFDIFRYVLGFVLLVKYMWDCSKERRMVLQDLSKVKIFLLNFLLALTEQTSIYPFISNLSISPDGSMLETSPLPTIGMGLVAIGEGDSLGHFIFIHACYLLGILIGSLSVLKFTCWFWENPAFNLYMWVISSYLKNTKMTTSYFYKLLNFTFLYLTMICAVSSIGYFGLDYTLTNPLGFIAQDRLIEQPEFGDPTKKDEKERFFPELSHLSVKPTDKNSRTRGGVRGRRERWKDSLFKYQMVDSSLYDQSMYSFLTVEDLNYGFDRFWLRRKMRNHKMNLRLLPGPLVRGLKKQLNPDKRVLRSDKETTPDESQLSEDLESAGSSGNKKYAEQKKEPPKEYEAKGVEFFRLLFEQYYHPNFHKVFNESNVSKRVSSTFKKVGYSDGVTSPKDMLLNPNLLLPLLSQVPVYSPPVGNIGVKSIKGNSLSPSLEQNFNLEVKKTLKDEFSALRKFTRNFNTRIKSSHAYPFGVSIALPPVGTTTRTSNSHMQSMGSGDKNNIPLAKPLWGGSKVGLFQPLMVNKNQTKISSLSPKGAGAPIYSKKWKTLFSKLFRLQSSPFYDADRTRKGKNLNNSRSSTSLFRTISKNMLSKQQQPYQGHGLLLGTTNSLFSSKDNSSSNQTSSPIWESTKKTMSRQKLSKKDRQILRYRSLLKNNNKQGAFSSNPNMLHTLKFYLQKEEAFKRKLKFYGASVFRKLSVGNNAPFFKTMMKRFFYYYKPTLRYKRTLQSASLNSLYRQTPRKKSRLAKKLTNVSSVSGSPTKGRALSVSTSQPSQGVIQNPTTYLLPPEVVGSMDPYAMLPSYAEHATVGSGQGQLRVSSLTKPTHSYSVLGKKASRYRSQIYRDVLQHWYYTPFNRLLLKLDIDAFMSRQPRAHFLTKKEEHLLHQRRFLLAEHFDTVRWYTYMQHYSSMKTKIGGTKSFSSGIYNQQFQGTFKKIRHLFAITPSQTFEQDPKSSTSAGFILKFDQPLYNEYPNTKQSSMLNSSVNHEELENMLLAYSPTGSPYPLPEVLDTDLGQTVKQPLTPSSSAPSPAITAQQTDLISESSNIVGNYLFQAAPIRQQFLAKLLKEKDYWTLTQFMFHGESLLDPKILHLALPTAAGNATDSKSPKLKSYSANNNNASYASQVNIQQQLWVQLLRQNKRHINDREYISNYVTHRINVTEQRNKEKQEQIQARLSHLNLWFNNLPITQGKDSNNNLSTGLQKSTNEALHILSNNNAIHTSTSLPSYSDLDSYALQKQINQTNKSSAAATELLIGKVKLIIGKVKNAIHFLTSPIRILDKQKRTLAWWRKKQQAKYTRKTNFSRYDPRKVKSPMQIGRMEKEHANDIKLGKNRKQQEYWLKYNIRFLRSQHRNHQPDNKVLKIALDAKEKYLSRKEGVRLYNLRGQNPEIEIERRAQAEARERRVDAVMREQDNSRQKKDFVIPFLPHFSNSTAEKQSPLEQPKGVKIKTSLYSKLQSSINHLFTGSPTKGGTFFTVKPQYNRGFTSRYKVFRPNSFGDSRVLKSSYFFRSQEIPDKESQQKLLEYVSKFAPPTTSQKKDQQKNGIAQIRERTKPDYNLQRYKHRTLQGMGKLRMLIKKIQRIKSNLLLQIWWWQHFLPNYQAEVVSQQRLASSAGSLPGLAQPAQVMQNAYGSVNRYKPLSTLLVATDGSEAKTSASSKNKQGTGAKETSGIFTGVFVEAENVLTKIYANLFLHSPSKVSGETLAIDSFTPKGFYAESITLASALPGKVPVEAKRLEQADYKAMLPYIKPVNPLPFYAGWDESLRKLVITNRFLSRRQAGQLLQPVLLPNGNTALKTSTGLNGLNEGSYLYNLLDMPFNAYAIEQFNGRAQTFYAPLGWRRFQFRHSILKTWFSLSPSLAGYSKALSTGSRMLPVPGLPLRGKVVTSSTISNQERNSQASQYFSNLPKGYPKRLAQKWMAGSIASNQAQKNVHRRTKKRWDLMVQGYNDGGVPYEPTGTLLTEVLPSHYLSIYDHQYRYADSRYLEIPFADLTSKKTTLSIPPNSCLSSISPGNTVSFSDKVRVAEAAPPKEKSNAKKAKEKIKSVPDELKCLLSTTIANNKLVGNEEMTLPVQSTFGRAAESEVGLDFTLRKRIKTQRKYHRQRTIAKNGLVFPRRRKFVIKPHIGSKSLLNPSGLFKNPEHLKEVEGVSASGSRISDSHMQSMGSELNLRWRPSSFKKLRSVKQEKNKKRATINAARLKQLRPREKQQVLIPTRRFQPRQGGFVWPGQYLLMEFTYLPTDTMAIKKGWTRKQHDLSINLNDNFFGKSTVLGNTTEKLYKRDSQETLDTTYAKPGRSLSGATTPSDVDLASGYEGALPRKYLIQKHNIKVLKKKLEKAYRSNKLQERIKQLNYMLGTSVTVSN